MTKALILFLFALSACSSSTKTDSSIKELAAKAWVCAGKLTGKTGGSAPGVELRTDLDYNGQFMAPNGVPSNGYYGTKGIGPAKREFLYIAKGSEDFMFRKMVHEYTHAKGANEPDARTYERESIRVCGVAGSKILQSTEDHS